jgi:hypothetical protein
MQLPDFADMSSLPALSARMRSAPALGPGLPERHETCYGVRCNCVARNTEASMTIAEQVYEQVKTLPDPLAREVLDFIALLRERRGRGEWHDLMAAQAASLAPVWDNAEDSVWDHA